jgi:hypothetical protein
VAGTNRYQVPTVASPNNTEQSIFKQTHFTSLLRRISIMTLAQIKQIVLSHMPQAEVKEYGDLRLKATWEAALAKCQEAIAIAADVAKETTIEVVDTVVLLAENSTGLGETVLETSQKVFTAIVSAVFITSCFFYYLGQQFGKGFYKVRQIADEIELEDLARPIVKSDPVNELVLMRLKSPMLASSIPIAS